MLYCVLTRLWESEQVQTTYKSRMETMEHDMHALSALLSQYASSHPSPSSASPEPPPASPALLQALTPPLEAALRARMQSLVGEVEQSALRTAAEQTGMVEAKVMAKVALTARAVQAIEAMLASTQVV